MGFTVKKIGFLELEKVLSVQADELAEELTEIRNRIAEIERHANWLDETSSIREALAEHELRPLLTVFLTKFSPKAFSPMKIRELGSAIDGFESLSSFDQGEIRAVLQSMVSEGEASTTISRMGNTLYRIND